jgi:hypothetical protein
MMKDNPMLTTVDNPYDPHTQFVDWDTWDRSKGYHTLAYLGRVVRTSDELSETDQNQAYDDAMSEIIALNGELYKKV